MPVAERLHVATETPAVVEARQNALRLLLARYRPGAGRPDNELLALADRYSVAASQASDGLRWHGDESNPFIRVDRDERGVPRGDEIRVRLAEWLAHRSTDSIDPTRRKP